MFRSVPRDRVCACERQKERDSQGHRSCRALTTTGCCAAAATPAAAVDRSARWPRHRPRRACASGPSVASSSPSGGGGPSVCEVGERSRSNPFFFSRLFPRRCSPTPPSPRRKRDEFLRAVTGETKRATATPGPRKRDARSRSQARAHGVSAVVRSRAFVRRVASSTNEPTNQPSERASEQPTKRPTGRPTSRPTDDRATNRARERTRAPEYRYADRRVAAREAPEIPRPSRARPAVRIAPTTIRTLFPGVPPSFSPARFCHFYALFSTRRLPSFPVTSTFVSRDDPAWDR